MSDVPPTEPAASTEVRDSTAEAKPEAKGDASSVEEGQIVSPSKPMAKHELEYEWVLWFDNPGGRQNVSGYGQSLRMVYSFKTVEDFWCLFNNIKPPSMFQPNVTYYLFKKGIEPKWECPANASGGSWSANIPAPKNHEAKRKLDEWWLHSVMACIGEQFAESAEVNGVAANVRRNQDRIELWTRTASNEAAQMKVGQNLREALDLKPDVKISYGVFEDKLKKGGKAPDRYSC